MDQNVHAKIKAVLIILIQVHIFIAMKPDNYILILPYTDVDEGNVWSAISTRIYS